mmetsp:Transcript_26065/g.35992  ORF Transcript_26065/g.35992 Transcript_26065/m.35992 type:complete len:247 (-) Transcript_26065:8-748(-)
MEADEKGPVTLPVAERVMRKSFCLGSVQSLQNLEDFQVAYEKWGVEYPSILQRFSEFESRVEGKKLVLFLDYDGTLTPIVRNPDEAFMPEETRVVLKEVASLVPTAIISGRCMEKVNNFVKLQELFYAGSHGLDIKGPDVGLCASHNNSCAYQPAAEYFSIMNEVHDALVLGVEGVRGSSVEHNKFCVSVHFRNCNPEDWDTVAGIVGTIVCEFHNLIVTHGKKVLEVRPDIHWNKGKAVSYLLKT